MKHKNLGIEIVGEELKMKVGSKVKVDSKVGVKGVKEMQVKVKVDSKVKVGSKARVVKGRKTLKQSRNFIPKFVSTIAALSLCVSSAVAHHSDQNWQINGGNNESNHTGNDSSSSGTTTISNLESGQKITTKNTATGTISSLLIQRETNNSNNPTLEVGSTNSSIVNVPKITIEAGATLNRTIQDNSQDNNKWNILFRGGSTIGSFENKGTISSSNKVDTVYLFTDEKTKNGNSNGGQTVVRNFTNNGTIESK
ncbi:MAG: hypothetical protein MSA68_04690, partial [Helicobacter sp.]|nr:hypothetical protein [Helicobacter sp.]